jgi:benzodiazapine receptor
MKAKQAAELVAAIVIVELIGNIGTLFALSAIGTWYASLVKPEFNPPDWVFAPVWVILFALMGISLYLVWERRRVKKRARIALQAFDVQLALNIFWPFLFFGLRSPLYGLICIVLLFLAILLIIAEFRRVSKAAAYLLIPYLLWVAFAAALNFSVWMLN